MTEHEKNDKEMSDLQLDARLEQLAHQQTGAPTYLASRIVANLPEPTTFDHILIWLRGSAWRGATALVLPLALGFVVGLNNVDVDESWAESESLVFADSFLEYDNSEI